MRDHSREELLCRIGRCPECKKEIGPVNVSFEEFHVDCGTTVSWVEEQDTPRPENCKGWWCAKCQDASAGRRGDLFSKNTSLAATLSANSRPLIQSRDRKETSPCLKHGVIAASAGIPAMPSTSNATATTTAVRGVGASLARLRAESERQPATTKSSPRRRRRGRRRKRR